MWGLLGRHTCKTHTTADPYWTTEELELETEFILPFLLVVSFPLLWVV